jgi:phosphate transport system permease protein
MIRTVVLPFGRGGMIGAIMLGIGRAMGETVAVATIISVTFVISPHLLQAGANSIAAFIVLRFGSGGALGLSALLGAGLVLI